MIRQPTAIQKRERIDPFSLSFLDIISCGFGAVVVLILIFRFDPFPDDATAPPPTDTTAAYNSILTEAAVSEKTEQAKSALDDISVAQATSTETAQRLQQQLDQSRQQLAAKKASNTQKKQQLAALKSQIEQVKIAGATTEMPSDPNDEAGGILVDRDYVIFIVDTSGSMSEIWENVAHRMRQIIQQHPRIEGIQMMNADGDYLFRNHARRWIDDTPEWRNRVQEKINKWPFLSPSYSNPAKGLRRALKDFQSSTKDISIYVLGDDYRGGDFDSVIEAVRKLNSGGARINAINFINPTVTTDSFSILMREIALENHGTLITM